MKYSKCVAKCLILFAFYSLLACQASDYSNPAAQPPVPPPPAEKPVFDNIAEGSVNGRAWKLVDGRASVFKRNGKRYLEIKLWNQSYAAPCEQHFGSTFQIRLYSENKVSTGKIDPGDPFSLIPAIIFSDLTESSNYRNNMVASKGEIRVTSIKNGRVKGSVQGDFKAENTGRTEVGGNFDVPFCESSSAPMNGSY
ncbi:hypothetical protein [Bdellovibrio svalbardensis]|uniref:Lipoprotein n=1 Tax=Bdellovibrio svalbardensis TaxID=2972972 RepID=A0ABT6DDH0_9BACT|nr:hypothetical protein [Bdellovibrio svalbardensis]MDG0814843.1 hypothetical protein [Bdellovibrio svalbardensis]